MFAFQRITVLALLLLAFAAPSWAEEPPPVVVELFTSQGCSSCPPADAYLGELSHQPGVLALAFHVDYWNYIGWTDPYAHHWSSERQRGYMKSLHQPYVFTPQMVVNGTAQGIGSERGTIATLIRAAAQMQPPHPTLALHRRADGALVIDVGNGRSPPDTPATLWLVGFGRSHTTDVLKGENEGQALTDYRPVETYRRVGAWAGWSLQIIVPVTETAALGDGGVAVLLQADGTGPILTAAEIVNQP